MLIEKMLPKKDFEVLEDALRIVDEVEDRAEKELKSDEATYAKVYDAAGDVRKSLSDLFDALGELDD